MLLLWLLTLPIMAVLLKEMAVKKIRVNSYQLAIGMLKRGESES